MGTVKPGALAPWRPGWSYDKTGSGAVIDGHRILTNAPGSSGGPLVHEGRLVGVAAQSTGTNDTLGCAVAVPVVRQFLEDVSDGRLDGLPAFRIGTQKLENPALRASLGVPDGETGVLVRTVAPASHRNRRSATHA